MLDLKKVDRAVLMTDRIRRIDKNITLLTKIGERLVQGKSDIHIGLHVDKDETGHSKSRGMVLRVPEKLDDNSGIETMPIEVLDYEKQISEKSAYAILDILITEKKAEKEAIQAKLLAMFPNLN